MYCWICLLVYSQPRSDRNMSGLHPNIFFNISTNSLNLESLGFLAQNKYSTKSWKIVSVAVCIGPQTSLFTRSNMAHARFSEWVGTLYIHTAVLVLCAALAWTFCNWNFFSTLQHSFPKDLQVNEKVVQILAENTYICWKGPETVSFYYPCVELWLRRNKHQLYQNCLERYRDHWWCRVRSTSHSTHKTLVAGGPVPDYPLSNHTNP